MRTTLYGVRTPYYRSSVIVLLRSTPYYCSIHTEYGVARVLPPQLVAVLVTHLVPTSPPYYGVQSTQQYLIPK